MKKDFKPATEKQINLLKKLRIKIPENISKEEAFKLINEKIDKKI